MARLIRVLIANVALTVRRKRPGKNVPMTPANKRPEKFRMFRKQTGSKRALARNGSDGHTPGPGRESAWSDGTSSDCWHPADDGPPSPSPAGRSISWYAAPGKTDSRSPRSQSHPLEMPPALRLFRFLLPCASPEGKEGSGRVGFYFSLFPSIFSLFSLSEGLLQRAAHQRLRQRDLIAVLLQRQRAVQRSLGDRVQRRRIGSFPFEQGLRFRNAPGNRRDPTQRSEEH